MIELIFELLSFLGMIESSEKEKPTNHETKEKDIDIKTF